MLAKREQTENALRESEAKYRKLVENSPVIVYQFMMTPDGSFSFPHINEIISDTLGVSAQDIVNDASTLLGMMHPDDRETFRERVLHSAESLKPYHQILRCLKGGETAWIEARSTPSRSSSDTKTEMNF
ncbi:MAG: PAS domain-containing protein [Deltaproteobacteria bacterium]|nr:PAS domain-containing protein [Deltaproteobacteria bacterium]